MDHFEHGAREGTQRPDGEVRLSPSWSHYRRRAARLPAIMFALLGFVVLLAARDPLTRFVVPLTLVACGGALWLFFGRAEVIAGPRGLVKRAWLARRMAAEAIGGVVLVPDLEYLDPRMDAVMFVVDRHGRGKVTFTAPFWTLHRMQAIARALPGEVSVVPGRVSLAEVRQRHPGSVPLWLGRPMVLSLLVVAGMAGLLLAIAGLGVLLDV